MAKTPAIIREKGLRTASVLRKRSCPLLLPNYGLRSVAASRVTGWQAALHYLSAGMADGLRRGGSIDI